MITPRNILVQTDFSLVSGRDFLIGVMRYARNRADWHLHLLGSPAEFTADKIRTSKPRTDGIITCTTGDPSAYRALCRLNIPVVLAGTHGNGGSTGLKNGTRVRLDEESIGRCAAQYLDHLGNFAAFGFVASEQPLLKRCNTLRRQGFAAELQRQGRTPVCYQGGSLSDWIATLPKPAAILSAEDRTAIAVLDACRAVGESVPECVCVLGIDNDALLCETAQPSLSSIRTDCEQEGYRSAAELDALFRAHDCRGKAEEVVVSMPVRVIPRRSTCPPAPATTLIKRANAFIVEHLSQPLSVSNIANAVGVSRRLLEIRFRQFLKCSVHDRISKLRLANVIRRLRRTSDPIEKIAQDNGFCDARHLKRLFKAQYGISPHAYRMQLSMRHPIARKAELPPALHGIHRRQPV